MKETTFDLLHTTDSYLLGYVGELMACKYFSTLMRKKGYTIGSAFGVHIHTLGKKPFKSYPFIKKPDYNFPGLSKEQRKFLKESSNLRKNNIDPIGFDILVSILGARFDPILVEVKTTRYSSPKRNLKIKQKTEDVEFAKKIGFKVMMIICELHPNWKWKIIPREL